MGTDLIGPAAEALKRAPAQLVGGALAVCHVLPNLRVHVLFPQRYAPEATETGALKERVRMLLGESMASLTGRAPASREIFVEHGTDYVEIVRCAETWRANLIVVGLP